MSRKNNTESAAYKRNRICIFYAVGDPAALLFDFFASWGDKCTAGGNLPPALNYNGIHRIFYSFIFGLVTRNSGGAENFWNFPTLPIDIVGIMVYS